MSLLKYPLLASALLVFAGCPGDTTKESDSSGGGGDADTDADSDSDSDSDSDADADAGNNAVVAWSGNANGDGSTLNGGSWGFTFYPYDYDTNTWDSNPSCTAGTKLVAANGNLDCPECEFGYLTEAVTGGSADGSACQALSDAGVVLATPDIYGGYGYQVGLGVTSNLYDYGIAGMFIYLGWYPDPGTFLFTYEYGDYNSVTINGNNFEWARVIVDSNSGYPLYYAY